MYIESLFGLSGRVVKALNSDSGRALDVGSNLGSIKKVKKESKFFCLIHSNDWLNHPFFWLYGCKIGQP